MCVPMCSIPLCVSKVLCPQILPPHRRECALGAMCRLQRLLSVASLNPHQMKSPLRSQFSAGLLRLAVKPQRPVSSFPVTHQLASCVPNTEITIGANKKEESPQLFAT